MKTSNPHGHVAALALGGLLLAIAGALIAQFSLDGLADSSQLWHQFQHGLLFASGIAAGASLVQLRAATSGVPA